VAGDPMAFAGTVEKAVHELNGDLPVYDVTSLALQVELASIGLRVAGTFVGAFGLLALVLAAVGIYGVISYSTRQRTREIGIRMALGAERTKVVGLVLSGASQRVLGGLILGVPLSIGAGRLISSQLYGVSSWDPLALMIAAGALAASAFVAAIIPASRAASISPMSALRNE